MRKLFTILLFLTACSKEHIEKPNLFTASVSINPTSKTLFYDVFYSNDKVYWLTAKHIVPAKQYGKQDISFDFKVENISGCPRQIDFRKPLYGCMRETLTGTTTDFEIKMYWDVIIK